MYPGEQGVIFGLGHLAKFVNVDVLVVGQRRVEFGVDLCVGPLTVLDHHLGPQQGERRDEAVHLAQPHLLQDFVHLVRGEERIQCIPVIVPSDIVPNRI